MQRTVTNCGIGSLVIACATAVLYGCGGVAPPLGTPLAGDAANHFAKRSTVQILYSFSGAADGSDPAADLTFDSAGKLWGTTVGGGAASCGTVFTLTPRSSPPWSESVAYNFTCYSDGKNPYGGVAFDSHENAYGTTVSGGSGPSCGSTGCGVAYELSGSQQSVLHSFAGGRDGFGPGAGVAIDRLGKVYGATPDGGRNSYGIVYQLSPRAGHWRERIIHTFTGGSDGGVGSLGRLLIDGTNNVYGVAELGGAHGNGTVFRLTATSRKRWHLTTLYAFKGAPDCASPYGGLVSDASGNLYGTTYYGGSNSAGCVFELLRNRRYRERILYSFKAGNDGSGPTSTPAFGASGLLYATTSMGGGSCDCGTIFRLNVRSGKETVLHSFAGGTDGAYPYYGMTADAKGNFYGTTAAGGNSNEGTVFRLVP